MWLQYVWLQYAWLQYALWRATVPLAVSMLIVIDESPGVRMRLKA